jgi:hypothetical protein
MAVNNVNAELVSIESVSILPAPGKHENNLLLQSQYSTQRCIMSMHGAFNRKRKQNLSKYFQEE